MPAPDAGQDAGLDAGGDGGRAVRDGGLDGGSGDAGPEAEWIALAGLPSVCDAVEVAVDPASAIPPLRFEGCGEGCRQVRPDWEPNLDGVVFHGMSDGSFHDGEHAYFAYERPWGVHPNRSYVLVARDDGAHLLALRTQRRQDTGPCLLVRPSVTADTFALALIRNTGFDTGGSIPVRERFDTPVAQWARAPERPWIADFVARAYTSDATTVFQGGLSNRYHRLGPTGLVDELARGTTLSVADVTGDLTLLGLYAEPQWQVVVFDPGATTPRTLIAPAGAGAGSPRTDGTDLVWLQLYEQEHYLRYGRVELWTSPFAPEPSLLTPRRIATVPLRSITRSLEVGFGRAWVAEDDFNVAAIYDLTTGERREHRLPPERFLSVNAILGPTEIGVALAYFPGYRGLETIRFVRYDTMPVVPPLP